MTYHVQTLPEMYEEWKETYEGPSRFRAIRNAVKNFQKGKQMVEVYAGDTLIWRNGHRATSFYNPSPFEMEWVAKGGELGIPTVPIYEYKTDKSYMQELEDGL